MNILNYDSYIDFLRAELERRVKNNPQYSLRSYARDLKMSPGEFSQILNEKRKLTAKGALKISQALGLSEIEKKHLLLLTQDLKLNAGVENGQSKSILDLEYFKVIEGWYHFAILNLSDCVGFKWDIKYISKRLGISPIEVKAALDRLLKVHLLKKKNKKIIVEKEYVETPQDIPSGSIKSYHQSILEKASTALFEQSVNEREISGVGFGFDEKYLPQVKKEIREFQDYLAEKYSKGRKNEVYQFETLFFRLSKKEEVK